MRAILWKSNDFTRSHFPFFLFLAKGNAFGFRVGSFILLWTYSALASTYQPYICVGIYDSIYVNNFYALHKYACVFTTDWQLNQFL